MNNTKYPCFTDIHSHILPDVDDGCDTLDEAHALVDSAIKNNVKNIILTPHFNCENNPIKKVDFLKKVRSLKISVKRKKLDIKIYPGMEVRASHRIVEFVKDEDYIVTLGGKNKYMLLELPFSHEPYKLPEILFKIKLMKIIPILAHPERYGYLANKIKYLGRLHEEGLLLQVNNSSLIKGWTASVSRRAVNMLKLGIIDFIGSDCHYMKGRFSNFTLAYDRLVKIIGRKKADLIAVENPNKILHNEDIN
ncbi:MAG: hypothetical protein K8S14_06615 [Actinomycetia bacterium]|nr:hypothetical protein [Actinomycetes bacterium]